MTEKVRLDKWLWAARFYKTRSLATAAINGGKVHVDGSRVKPSRSIMPGNKVTIHKEQDEKTVQVKALSDKRGPAKIAVLLYEETAESLALRETRRMEWKVQAQYIAPEKRPNKKQRRHIIRFKQSSS